MRAVIRPLAGRLTVASAVLVLLAASPLACDDDDPATDTGDTAGDTTDDTSGSAAEIARGKYIVHTLAVCVDCHSPRLATGAFDDARTLAGVDCFLDIDPTNTEVGCVNTPNLTAHATGLLNRTDQEIKDMFLKGVRPNGDALHPFMPYWVFGNMTAADADSVVAYLRSLPGVDHQVAKSQAPWADFPAAVAVLDLSKIPTPANDYPARESALRGRYIAAGIGICLECHTPEPEPGSSTEPRILAKAFQGGRAFPAAGFGLPSPPFPETIFTANITPHATGIAGYTAADIVKVLKQGVDPKGKGICPPMPSGPMGEFVNMTDGDALDLANYLLSLPPGDNAVPNGCEAPLGP
jgi:mono/diheme cytochrome c family protein